MAYDLYNLVGVYKSGSTMIDRVFSAAMDLQNLLVLPSQYHEITVTDQEVDHIEALLTEDNVEVDLVGSKLRNFTQTKELWRFQEAFKVLFLGIIFFKVIWRFKYD